MNKEASSPARVAVALPKPDQKTVVVVGSGRGGTSAVAGAVHLLGVRMVEGDYELNSEDYEIVRAYQRNMCLGHQRAAEGFIDPEGGYRAPRVRGRTRGA